jgi:nuclear pore complex protein Nup93
LYHAELGGVPGTFQLVKSYLKIKILPMTENLEDGLVDGQPVWPLIYFCLRCGDLDAAMQVVTQAQNRLDDFRGYLQEYMQSRDSGRSQSMLTRIRTHYRRIVRLSSDPYKKAVYSVIGCCDVTENHSQVAVKTDDYMWLKLRQVTQYGGDTSRDSRTGAEDSLTLKQLQTILKDEYGEWLSFTSSTLTHLCQIYRLIPNAPVSQHCCYNQTLALGESHFHAADMPLLFFLVLLLSMQFEAALEFLSRVERYRSHAVHFAIALYDSRLLILPDSIQAPLR